MRKCSARSATRTVRTASRNTSVFRSPSAPIATRIRTTAVSRRDASPATTPAAGRKFRCKPSTSASTTPRRSFRWGASTPASDCAQCHANGDFKKPLVFQKCVDCHKPDPHNGQFAKRPGGGECASCHTVQGWKPSTFTVKEHATSAYPLQGKHATVDCAKCHIPKGKDTLFKVKFDRCTDCHADQHAGQFVAAPYFNACDRCHNLEGYKPSTFGLARHKETHFVLTGGHLAVPCSDCHKESVEFQTKPTAIYHWKNLNCASCHADPHKGQFKERMQQIARRRLGGRMRGLSHDQVVEGTFGLRSFEGEVPAARSASRDGLHRLPQASQS